MTAQAPVPKAIGSPAPLASPVGSPPLPQPPVNEDFLAVILQAITGRPSSEDNSQTPQPAKEKSPNANATAPDLTVTSLLLALLVPPLPILLKSPMQKGSVHSAPVLVGVPSSAPTQAPTSTTSADETKPQRKDAAAAATAILAPSKEPESKPPTLSGTPVAIDSERMNPRSQRNEIAGRVEQKLPPAAIPAVNSTDTGSPSPDGGTQTPMSFSWHEAPSEQLAIIDLSAKAIGPVAMMAESSVEAPVRVSSPASIDRLEQMISREAMTVRQTGAQTLGVSLKLDSNTQLFLQLTTNNGLVQASVRCDRGQFAPEDAQWAQLQQSLARQNVELLPMTGSSNLNFQQPSGEHPRQMPNREDRAAAEATVPPPQPRKQKEQNRARKNWESWA